jgi:Na+-driven multidrug efflux pump
LHHCNNTCRPLNSVLVAQRITQPQTIVAMLMVPVHVAYNYLFIHSMKVCTFQWTLGDEV